MKRKPLKRHPALIPLSHIHRKALMLAQLLKSNTPNYKGMPTQHIDKITYAQQIYKDLLLPHFEQEEKILIPLTVHRSDQLSDYAQRIIDEHQQLKSAFIQLHPEMDLVKRDQLGVLLEKHIRFEEREWFTLIQNTLKEEELSNLKL